MKHLNIVKAICIGCFLPVMQHQTLPNPLPGKTIICLTYDDGLESQLHTALPQLDSVGLKATFFLNSIQGSIEAIGKSSASVLGWKHAALEGHELGNHTLFHACPQALGWPGDVAVESYTVQRILKEIETQNNILSLLDPDRTTRSFAFPCNNSVIRDTDYADIIRRKGLVKYGRTGGDRNSIITDFTKINTMKVPSWLVEESTTSDQLIEFAEKAKKANGMALYQFHSIGGGPLFRISSATHRTFLNYLKQHEAEYWVTTFSEAMDFISSRK